MDNIRMDLQEVGCGYMDWNGLVRDRDRWRKLVGAVMNLRVPWNAGNFLTSCKPVSFSRRTLHHGVSKLRSLNGWTDGQMVPIPLVSKLHTHTHTHTHTHLRRYAYEKPQYQNTLHVHTSRQFAKLRFKLNSPFHLRAFIELQNFKSHFQQFL